CHDTKRPVGFATQKDSQQVLFVLKRIHGPGVFPYRLADGSRAFPPGIETVKKATPPPQNAPTPKDNNKYDLGPTAPGTEEPPATKKRPQERDSRPAAASESARPQECAPTHSLRIAATVNGEAILAEEVYAAAYLSLPDAHNLTALDRSRRITAVWRKTLDRVIEREVIVQEAFRVLKAGNANVPKRLQEAAANEFGRKCVETVSRSPRLKDNG